MKKINWKRFTKMYYALGKYRIVKIRGDYRIEIYYDSIKEWKECTPYPERFWFTGGPQKEAEEISPLTEQELKDEIFSMRYELAKKNRDYHKNRRKKVTYKHP